MIYLDAAATTATRTEVLHEMWPYLTGDFGNPSSHHRVGERAARALAGARAEVARWLGCRSNEIVFTSGGTEADNLAVKGISLARPRGRHIVTSAIEHPAVLESCDYLRRHHGFEVTILGVDGDGSVDLDEAGRALRPDTTLCTVMLANNEIGTVQPIAELAALARAHQVPIHTDAVQAAGTLDLSALDVDAMSVSGHKIGAPKGIGALYVRGRVRLEALVHGGGQESERRSGTENLAGAVGLAAAARLAGPTDSVRMAGLRDAFIADVLTAVPDAVLTGHRDRRLTGHASFCFPRTSGETVLLRLEQDHDVICSSGSACAAGSSDPSPVLLAMGFSAELAHTAVRFTFGPTATPGELRAASDGVVEAVGSVRNLVR